MTDSRKLVKVDERFPASLSGEAGKQLIVNDAETAYEHANRYSGAPIGSLILYMFDSLPTGYIPVGGTYNYDDYPALGALFGVATGETFTVPEILFIKNSEGVNTGTQEAEEVGTHGHTADAMGSHDHPCTARAVGNHTHPSSADPEDSGEYNLAAGPYPGAEGGTRTGAGGAHTHIVDLSPASAGTPVINNHSGTNQPACTLINIGIKF